MRGLRQVLAFRYHKITFISPNPKFPYQKKLRFFGFFLAKGGEREGGSHLFQKGVIIKKWGFWAIFAKKGGHIDFIKKKLGI